ncbi:MAG: hypothetical protein WA231_22695 [Methylocella sp.]
MSSGLEVNPEAAYRRGVVVPKNPTFSDLETLQSDSIEIEEPTWWDLRQIAETNGIAPAAEIRSALSDHQFWLVQLGFSIVPAGDHIISWARFLVKFEYAGQTIGPQVHSLLPRQTLRDPTAPARAWIGADFRLYYGADHVDQPIALFSYESVVLKITGVGNLSSKPSWDVRAGQPHGVHGYVRTYVVVRKQTGTMMQSEFSFNARIETVHGNAGAVPPLLGGLVFRFNET